MLMLDLPFVALLLLSILLPHRLCVSLRDVCALLAASGGDANANANANDNDKASRSVPAEHHKAARRTIALQFLLGLLDPLVLLARIALFLTVYRNSRTQRRLSETNGFFARDPLLVPGQVSSRACLLMT